MDTESIKDGNGCVNKPVAKASLDDRKVEDHHANGEDDSDSKSLLPPRIGGMSRKLDKSSNKTRRKKVQWNDKNGNKLVEVLEYVPSDVSDSENEDEDEDGDSCICTIM